MWIRRPGHQRVTYGLVGDDNKKISDLRIDAVNRDLRLGVPHDELEQRMRSILSSYKPEKPPLLSLNLQIVEEYRKSLLRRPELQDPYALYRRAVRSVEALGTTPLRESTKDELLDSISHVKDLGVRYHVIGGLNTLLRFVNRDVRFRNPSPPGEASVKYIEVKEFLAKIHGVPDKDYRAFIGSLFATGCRVGELPVCIFQGGAANIPLQLDRSMIVRRTKNKKVRSAPIIPDLKSFITDLQAIPANRLQELREKYHHAVLDASKSILGLKLHDLRHSYAVAWAKQGKSLAKIAKWIGDTEAVCEKHYSRYLPSNDELEREVASWKY